MANNNNNVGSCPVCGKKAEKICSACQTVAYCSVSHQRQDWKSHKKICSPPYKIVESQDDKGYKLGLEMVATRDLKAGSIILKDEEPILKSPWWHKTGFMSHWATCLGCGSHVNLEEEEETKYCDGCGWPVCDDKCEKMPDHADNECKIFASLNLTFPTSKTSKLPRDLLPLLTRARITRLLLLLRVLALKRNDRVKYDTLMNLQSEPGLPESDEDVKNQQRIDDGDLRVLEQIVDFPQLGMTVQELKKIFWIHNINAFMGHDYDGREEKYRIDCLYKTTSRTNNSCTPNCSHSCLPCRPKFYMTVRTAVPMKAGESLTISYVVIENFRPTLTRQKDLRKNFYFICRCQRCTDPTELNTFNNAFACPRCHNNKNNNNNVNIMDDVLMMKAESNKNMGYLLPVDPLNIKLDALWSCNQCKYTVPVPFLPKFSEIEKIGRHLLKDDDNPAHVPIKNFRLEDLEDIIKRYGGHVHPNHWVIQSVAGHFMETATTAKNSYQPGELFQKVKTFCLYRLTIEDVLAPGISYFRGRIQLLLCKWILTQLLVAGAGTAQEFKDLVALASDLFKEAMTFYKQFRNGGVPHGEFNFNSLKESEIDLEDAIATAETLE